MEVVVNKHIDGQRILDLCRAVSEIQDYNSPDIALSWIRLIEETEEPLKLTSRQFIDTVRNIPPVVQSAYFSAIRDTKDMERLTSVPFMSELKRMKNDEAINRLKEIMRKY